MTENLGVETCLCCGRDFAKQHDGDKYCEGCTEDAGFWGEACNLLDGAEPEPQDE